MLKWDEKFSVGYELFDDHHKILIECLNLVEALLTDKTIHNDDLYSELKLVLDEMILYTGNHFKSEELLFDEYDYVLCDEHKEKHKIFVFEVKDLVSSLKYSDDERKTGREIYNKLLEWLMAHIMKEDMKYKGKLG